MGDDYGASSIDPVTGAVGGSIARGDSLTAYGRTLSAAVGIPSAEVDSLITGGTPVQAALVPGLP